MFVTKHYKEEIALYKLVPAHYVCPLTSNLYGLSPTADGLPIILKRKPLMKACSWSIQNLDENIACKDIN
jgi:hypothetical protein